MRTTKRTGVEQGVLTIVDAFGMAQLGTRNDARTVTVDREAADALVKAGVLFKDADAVRRRELQIDGAAPGSGKPIEVTVWRSLVGGIELRLMAPAELVSLNSDGIACVRVHLTPDQAHRVLVQGIAAELAYQEGRT